MQDGNVLWPREVVNLLVHWRSCLAPLGRCNFRFRMPAKQAGGSSSLPPGF